MVMRPRTINASSIVRLTCRRYVIAGAVRWRTVDAVRGAVSCPVLTSPVTSVAKLKGLLSRLSSRRS